MVSYYPAYIDTSASLPQFVDGQPVQAAPVERLRETIIAIEAELGIRPRGVYTTVRARLDALELAISNIHVIQLAGDLGGTLESPKVIGIQGRPVSDAEPSFNQVLGWNGIAWVPTDQTGGGGGGITDVFILRPSDSPHDNVYQNWTALMAARSLVDGPATIVIDHGNESNATVDPGIWNLKGNTKITGADRKEIILVIPDGASIQDPSEFENIRVRASRWSETVGSIHFTFTGLDNSQFVLRDAALVAGSNVLSSGVAVLYDSPFGGRTIKMYGNSLISTDDNFSPIYIGSFNSVTIEMYDAARTSDSIFASANPAESFATVEIYGEGVNFDDRQSGVTLTVNYYTNGPLVYQPSGSGSNRTLTSWTNVMNARSTIRGPVTIIIDDSILSPAPIDTGTWDLKQTGYPTKIQGHKTQISSNNAVAQMSVLSINNGGQLSNASEFENIIVAGNNEAAHCIIFDSLMNVKAYDAVFRNSGGSFFLFDVENSSYADYHLFELYGNSSISGFSGPGVLGGAANGVFVIQMNDYSTLDADTISLTGGVTTLTIQVNNIGSTWTLFQPSTTATREARVGFSNVMTGDNSLAIGTNNTIGTINATITGGTNNSISSEIGLGHIGGGNTNSISADKGTIGGGQFNSIGGGGSSAFIGGGETNNINGLSAVIGGGYGNTANGVSSTVPGGQSNSATGDYSTAIGIAASGRLPAQVSFGGAGGGGGVGRAQTSIYQISGQAINATPQILTDANGGEFILEDGHAYLIRANVIMTGVSINKRAAFVRTLLVHCTAGTATIDSTDTTLSIPNGTSWTIAFSVTSNILRATATAQLGDAAWTLVSYDIVEMGFGL